MNLTRSHFRPLTWLAALTLPGAFACTAPSAADQGATGTDSEPLCAIGVTCGPTNPPTKPVLPAGTYVKLESADLQFAMNPVLAGTTLSVDTTGHAPIVDGPGSTTVPNPAYVACNQGYDCYAYTGPALAQCLKEERAACAQYPSTISQPNAYYSYVLFSPFAKSNGASDVFFPLQTLHHSGTFSFDIDINQLHASLFPNTLRASFVQGPATNSPSISFYIPSGVITSGSPTLITSGDYPDVNLTDMSIGVMLGGIAPTADGLSLDYGTVESLFSCNVDINDVPDGLLSVFYDVNAAVESNVEARMNTAFGADSSHKALSKALTTLAAQRITEAHAAGYTRITKALGIGSSFYVYYTPK